ncbi:MAG TPA: hypothetical protein VMO78_02920 [Rhizomicrobium sp.]|nr:hypothetical protein [Rhizomicrobium sp.]
MQAAIGASKLVGQVAGLRAAFGQIAMQFAGDKRQNGTGGGETRLGFTIARGVQMDAVCAGRQVMQVEGDQRAAIDGGEIHRADRLSVAGSQIAMACAFCAACAGAAATSSASAAAMQ